MSNWWAARLSGGGNYGTSTTNRTPTPPSREGPARPAPPPTTNQQPQPHSQRPPQSSLQQDHCPACGSSNYMQAPQYPNSAKRCLECGYPVVQSGSGVSGVGQTDGSVKQAKQVQGGGFNPTTIVGKVE